MFIAKSIARSGISRKLSTSACIDVHTHMYLPKYMDILKKRTVIPKVITVEGQDRLIILPGEDDEITTSTGRPIGREYFDVKAKLQYMDNHKISHSVISLANPWLDFLSGNEAENVAQELNDELQGICQQANGKLYGFATLPVRNQPACIKEVKRLKSLPHIKGVILGTPGAGDGMDAASMRGTLEAIAAAGLTIFLHPHYGVGNQHYNDTGHALFLALGFPFETTVSISRLICTGAFDLIPNLKIIVAHAGAALPALIGRLDSCVEHDALLHKKLKHKPSYYFKNLYFDAISYNPVALQSLATQVGTDRIMFGTDNPFFPPLDTADIFTAQWPSTNAVHEGIQAVSNGNIACKNEYLYGNAARLLNIKV